MSTREQSLSVARQLVTQGRLRDAVRYTGAVAEAESASYAELNLHARVLDLLGRKRDALQIARRGATCAPANPVALRNVAALEAQLSRWADAESSILRCMQLGGDDADTWATLARVRLGQQSHAEAESAYREALKRDASRADVHRDLANLMWTTTGDIDLATKALRAELVRTPDTAALAVELANALRFAGFDSAAYAAITDYIRGAPAPSSEVEVAASNIAGALGDGEAALTHATRAVELAPDSITAILALGDGYIATGRLDAAEKIVGELYRRLPDAQQVIARMATIWRLSGDDRYRELCDYDRVLRREVLSAPSGWPTEAAFFAELATALRAQHTTRAHPFNQSLRNGTQTHADLIMSDERAIQSFLSLVEDPIRRYLSQIGTGDDPLRRRNDGTYRISSAWSVLMACGGLHVNHVHRYGWISAVCHVEFPKSDPAHPQAGWLKLGEPGIATHCRVEADLMIQPQPYQLILFPSYVWHGTEPVKSGGDRLSIAFDVVPQTFGL